MKRKTSEDGSVRPPPTHHRKLPDHAGAPEHGVSRPARVQDEGIARREAHIAMRPPITTADDRDHAGRPGENSPHVCHRLDELERRHRASEIWRHSYLGRRSERSPSVGRLKMSGRIHGAENDSQMIR